MKTLRLVAFGLALAASSPVPSGLAGELTAYKQLGRDLYQRLVETDTTHSHGDTTPAATWLAQQFRNHGFPQDQVQVVGRTATNRNLVVRYRGTGERPPVVFLAHLDVVEAARQEWSFDPFKLTETNGFFYGRGTSDDKDGAASLAAAFLRLRDEGFKPDRDLILALTSGEESGEENGVEWLLQNRRDLVNGVMCFNADAGGPAKRGQRTLFFGVQAAEKTYLSFRLEAKSAGGHSSLPTPDNAIYHLANALVRLAQHQFPVELNEITRESFRRTAQVEQGQTGTDMLAVLKTPPDPEALRRLSASPIYNALLRTTAVATMIEGGHAENALPMSARATVNCRLLPGDSPAEVEKVLRKVIADDRISLTPIKPAQKSPASPLEPEVMQSIEHAKDMVWPGLVVIPEMATGATDGLFFRQLGIPTYGINGTATDLNDIRAHGKDERVAVKDFYNGLEFEYELVKRIARR
jgi:acetylornithine deacetylase/succinyl-diaminopimelate desuccinylase-like protein